MSDIDEPTARLAQLTPARRALLEKWKRGKSGGITEIVPRRDAGPVPLSFQQQRLWFLHQLEPDAAAYTMSVALELTGTLHIQALEQSLTLLVQRHEPLRTCFPTLNEQPFQHILPPMPLRLMLLDLSFLTADARQKEIHLLLKRQVQRPISLAAGPLFRQSLLRLAPQKYVLLLTMHHTIYDGLSLNILLHELAAFYSATLAGVSASLSPLPLNYADYAIWQREWFQGKEQAALTSYWKQQLQNAPALLELPTDRPRQPVQTHNGARLRFPMSDLLISKLKSWGKQEGATLFMVTIAAFQILLARYSGQRDFVLGIPIANRSRPEFEPLIGFFANTLALRTTIAGNPTFRSFLQQTRSIALEAFAHQELPFEQLVEILQPPRSLSYNPLVQIIFSLDELVIPTLEMPGLTLGIFPADGGLSQFDLTFALIDINNSIEVNVLYNTDLFDETTISHIVEHYLHLLSAAVDNPEQGIYALPLLLESEQERILFGWNETHASYPETRCIHELFEEQARRTPDALAVVLDECALSYQELNKRANQLAWYLRALEVGPERLVGLCLTRSLEMLVSLLGILKAGGAYLPLDPSYPRERLAYLIEDSQVELVLTRHDLSAGIEVQHLTLLDLASEWPRIAASSGSEVQSGIVPSNLAYVIYTSGSSGQPKGVLISHSALVSHSITIARRFELHPADRVLQFASLSFDVAAEEIFPTWLAGAGLVLHSSQSPLSFEDLTTLLWQRGLTVLNLPTSYWHLWTAHLVEAKQSLPDSLRLLVVGSESALLDQLQNWCAHYGQQISWRHAYGVTESTITSTLYEPSPTPAIQTAQALGKPTARAPIPIGRPLDNTQIYLLDANLQPVPIGVVADLYIGGVALARGYHRRPELTAERFIPHPFAREVGARLYKTGDCARYRRDGTLEFLGRSDTQLKVRGYRIEPGEIEARLREHPDIQEAVVKANHNATGEQQLVVYVLPNAQKTLSEQSLRQFLAGHLPSYMLPDRFVLLDTLPRQPGGKIDRAALTPPTEVAPDYTGPRTDLEELLAGIWADLLKCERVSVFANFFVLGGHSLLATRLLARVREAFRVELSLQKLFEAPTVAELAQVIAHEQGKQESYADLLAPLPPLTPVPEERYQPFPLTEVLQAYWIGQYATFELGNVSTHAYLEVQKNGLDLERFTSAWRRLVERHDLLRTIILPEGQMQILRDVPPYEIPVSDLRGQDQHTIENHLQAVRHRMSHQILPTERWPQFELLATWLDDEIVMLHISLGPLTGDGTSWAIIDRELAYFYADPAGSLPPFAISYRDYVLAELALKQTAIYQRSQDYWRRRLPTLPPAPDLPLSQSPSALTAPRFVRRSLVLEAEDWQRVKSCATRRGLTPSAVVLTAFAEVLARWSKAARFTINLTVFNRLPLHPQVNDLVGDFTSLTLLEIDHTRAETFTERARRVQQQLWEDLDHRYFDGIQVLRELARMQGNTLEARMPIVFTSTLGYRAQENTTPSFISGNVRDSITQTPQVWIDNQVFETQGALVIHWDAVEELFPPELLSDMFAAYRDLLTWLASDEGYWESQFSHLLPAQQVEQQHAFNQTSAPLANDLLHTLFFAQLRQRPDALAIIAPQKTLSYRELSLHANQIARRLRTLGAAPNKLVAVVMEKGWEQVVAVMGILIAGAAYLPIDAELPDERISYLLEHGEVSIALAQSWLEEQIRWPHDVAHFSVDTLEPGPEEAKPLECVQQPEDLAYVIYTSGSTGLPKGVMINHIGAVNTILDMNERFSVGPADRVLALSALSFDLSVYDIFGMLAAGACIVLPGADTRLDPAHWTTLLTRERVTIWNTVPALLAILVEYLNNLSGPFPSSLRLALLSGDWIPLTLPDQARSLVPDLRVISLGGATEASIWSILYPIEEVESTWKSIPYGRPMRNQRFYVLNERLEPCPAWVPGQLYIGGVGLAQGYWHDAAKTDASFLQHPATGERLYRTGDLGRYLPSGNIEFLGREDFQVKIQGHRIELGEIEAALACLDGIQTAILTARGPQQGNRRLVAYIVPQPEQTFTPGELRAFLQQKLPAYMLPSNFVFLESLPLTPNGKIDRNALPDPASMAALTEDSSLAAKTQSTDMQAAITRLVALILQLDQIDPEENLLDLGANSVDMLRILNLIEKELHFRPPMAQFFSQPSIQRLVTDYEYQLQRNLPIPEPAHRDVGNSAIEVLQNPLEREALKQQHRELRSGEEQRQLIPLLALETDEQLHARYLSRRSQRHFTPQPISFEHMSALLGCLRRLSIEGEARHLYPSAGALYPIQVYLHIKAGRVENLRAGVYYYHPVRHQLVALSPQVELDPGIHDLLINQPIFVEAAFSLFLIAQLSAIAPLYGSFARDFCLLEAGYMSQLLMETAANYQIGLCPIGNLNFAQIQHFFALDEHQILVHSLLGGAECEEGEL